jgi:cell wall-associated NlpC family hydrolase
MFVSKTIRVAAVLLCVPFSAIAEPADNAPLSIIDSTAPIVAEENLFSRATNRIEATVGEALTLLGVPYRRGGATPEQGFDCSGFVRHVFDSSVGLILPHNAKAMAAAGDTVDKKSLQPGDLVFFNTMRRTFSHVGIYLGEGFFVHAPRSGAKVRVEKLDEGYWRKRYNGARRINQD